MTIIKHKHTQSTLEYSTDKSGGIGVYTTQENGQLLLVASFWWFQFPPRCLYLVRGY